MGNVAQLNIGKDGSLALPVDVATQKLAFLGRTGSGKSYAATKLAELLLEAGAQIVALDPVGIWHGLRQGDGFDIPVFGGLHGDVPIESTGGTFLADLIVDRGISAVLDVSQMLSSEQARFATDFATRFFHRKKAAPSAVHLFVEECQEFIPQNCQRGEEKMLHAFERLIKLGRNFGIGASLISQRPQEVNKKAVNQAECLFAFQMTGPHERKAMKEWVASKGVDEDIDEVLPRLAIGQAHVWSPSWLKVSKTIRIAQKRSADASSTPLVGQRQAAAQPLKPIDLERIRADMAATIERAKADDPKELRRRIVELDRELLKVRGDKPAAEKVEVPVITAADMERLERHLGIFNRGIERLEEMHASVGEYIEAVLADVAALRAKADAIALPVRPVATICNVPRRPETRAAVAKMASHVTNGASKVQRGAFRSMMVALAQAGRPLSDGQIAARAGMSLSGTFDKYLSQQRTNGWVTGDRSALALTAEGLAALGNYEPLPTGAALREYWLGKVSGGKQREMLEVLFEAYPAYLKAEDVAARAQMALSGTFDKYLSQLRTLLLVEGQRAALRASAELFDVPSR